MTETDTDASVQSTKVERVIESYDLHGLGEELEHRWTGEHGERDSLRTLADVFNRQVLEQAMVEAGMDMLDGTVENIYRLLTDPDVTSGDRTETETRLEQEAIDVEELRRDFVTYQAIRTYLKDVRGASHSSDTTDSIVSSKSNFERLAGRATAVVDRKLALLRNTGTLSLGQFRVRTAITVYCEDCETQFDVVDLLNRGGCDCERQNSE